MNKNKYIYIILFAVGLMSFPACDDFLDINEDPNNPVTATLAQQLVSVQVNIAGALGASVQSMGDYTSLYTHHTVQRGVSANDYAFKGDDSGVTAPWRLFYTFALTDIENIIVQGTEEEQPNYVAIGKILKGASFSYMVDMWGDIPFFNANQGAVNPFPEYDDDEAIYAAIHQLLQEGISELNASAPTPGINDLFYGGDLNKWRKFAKTLRLKMLTQERLVRDVSAEVNALLSEGDLISDQSEDFQLAYGTSVSPNDRNPAYVQEWAPGGARNYISPYFFEIMFGLNTFHDNEIYLGVEDPRIPYYFYNQMPEGATDADAENPCAYCPSITGTPFLSIYTFSFNIDPNEGFDQSSSQTIMGLYPLGGRYDDGAGVDANFNGNPSVPQRILTYYARKFLEAELAITGVTAGNARALFEEGIRAAMAKVNEIAAIGGAPSLPQEDIDNYVSLVLTRYDDAPSDDARLEHIMTQKWIATFGFGVDAYTDYRRTGYPRLHDGNTDDLNVTSRGREYALTFPYPQVELNTNPNAPEQQRLIAVDRVFWDIN